MAPKSPLSIRTLITLFLFVFSLFLSIQIIVQAKKHQKLKIDQSELYHIRYGLLNVDEWEEKIAVIITEKINEFELTPNNREQMQKSVENILYRLLDEVDEVIRRANKERGFLGSVKQFFTNVFLDIDKIRENVPQFATAVLEEMNKPETKEELKEYLLVKLEDFAMQTFNKDAQVKFNSILESYECTSKEECEHIISTQIQSILYTNNYRVILLIILIIIIFLINLIPVKPLSNLQAFVLIISTFLLLLCGITTPMIEIEAKISMLIFQLLGEEIFFRNQILYFQSKSITDVVMILISDGKLQMIFVGFLIFSFSIIFPVLKLGSSFFYYSGNKQTRNNWFVKFFVLKSGKWSMADVMVVAMFMAFIGFNGIVSSQLDHISNSSEQIEILTTNGTELLPGFYLFLSFCLASLFLSEVFSRQVKD